MTATHVEVLFFDGCPNSQRVLARIDDLLADTDATVELRRVEDTAAAERECFLGSPTIRVNGIDVDPGTANRTDYGMKCRLYTTNDGLQGVPPDAWIQDAFARARKP
jgi:hypothetical protein